jgi:hypothetical protein
MQKVFDPVVEAVPQGGFFEDIETFSLPESDPLA